MSVQKDVTKRLFLSASAVRAWRQEAIALPLWRSRYAQVGAGWRFTRDWMGQYLVTRDDVFGRAQHLVGIRYTFRIGE